MASTPPIHPRPRSPPALIEELIEEILLRLPPEEPAYLVRAALVCKAWRNVLSAGGGFLRRYREFHGTPPMLGYLSNTRDRAQFVSTTSAASPPMSMPKASHSDNIRWVLDCRHGRVLIHDRRCSYGSSIISFIIWDPITRDMKHVKVYRQSQYSYTAAVLCAIDGCDHLSCHGGPSHVVLVQKHIVNEEHYYGARARIYSSDTDAWGAASTSVVVHSPLHGMPSLLIGDALYFTPNGQWDTPGVLKYDMGIHVLSMIPTPGVPFGAIAMKAHDGGLGFIAMSGNCLYLMSQQATGGGWARLRTIELEMTTLPSKYPRRLFGYADGTDTIFVSTNAGLFTLNIMSRQVRKVAEIDGCYGVVPYTSFFTPDLSKGRPSPP